MDCTLNVFIGVAVVLVVILAVKGAGLMYPKKRKQDTFHGFWLRRVK